MATFMKRFSWSPRHSTQRLAVRGELLPDGYHIESNGANTRFGKQIWTLYHHLGEVGLYYDRLKAIKVAWRHAGRYHAYDLKKSLEPGGPWSKAPTLRDSWKRQVSRMKEYRQRAGGKKRHSTPSLVDEVRSLLRK
jgi:hypothetical protein